MFENSLAKELCILGCGGSSDDDDNLKDRSRNET